MRARSHSGVRLDQLSMLVERTILSLQNPITGLFANNNQDFPGHAWVRDNLYAAQALWAMYRAYQKSADFDEDVAKANELALTCVKIMQSLLECFMLQADKVEQFKLHQRPGDALHAKYSVRTKGPVCGDENWGHLQIDATSLFLLTLAQMTASGLQIVRNFDEVAFVQNLVYYIETGYRTPDYGIWERGDKTNQGIRELNASSIGMVKAALQALNDVGDLFGDGSKGSVIHVLPDQIQQCSAVLSGMLPRESFSKETDAGLLSIISYPAFAVEDPELVRLTRETVMETLLGRYGCRRFLRDGYKTPVEDPNRLYYRNDELQQFEGIECEWPLFLCYFTLDAMFSKNTEMTTLFWNQLDKCVIEDSNNRKHSFIRLVPELYKVPSDLVFKERNDRGTQQREPAGTAPFLWAQSLYIICSLIHDGFLSPAELDPLSRRLSVYEKRPPCEVQVVILADNADVQKELAMNDIAVQRVDEIDPVFCIQPAYVFSKILSKLGESKKLRLSGRPTDRDVGLLSTSKLYQLGQKFIVFTPQFMDRRRSHLMYDIRILMDEWSSELQYIYSSWNSTSISGRPLVVLVISKNMLQSDSALASPGIMNRHMKATVVGTIKKISNGYLGGARVVMKNISEFFRTTAVSTLEFHNTSVEQFLELSKPSGESKGLLDETVSVASSPAIRPSKENPLKRVDSIKDRRPRQFNLVHKTSMRHRSIVLDSNDADLVRLRLAYASPKVPPTPTSMSPLIEKPFPSLAAETPLLHTTWSSSSLTSESSGKLDMNQMGEMDAEELVDMLKETNILDEQASIIHYLWMKFGPSHDTQLNGRDNITVRMLMNEVYTKACDSRDWALVRLTAGLLKRYLDELPMSVNHLLVRQKQLTVGMPSKNEEAITCPKTREEMRLIMERAYGDDPNSFTLAQEIMVSLGSLVRTEPKLFVEMFRLRIGLIIQVLASELARLRNLNAEKASQALLTVSPFELKSMLVALLNGRLLEEIDFGLSERGGKELRTGMGSFRKQIEERKSLRKSMHGQKLDTESVMELSSSDSDDSSEDFQFGIWLRHRRIDGALNRVPADFYASVWDSVRMFPQGISINHINLHWGVTQEMTRREIKFALQVEQVLNQVAEPEYREMIVEALTLIGQLEKILKCPPVVRCDRSFEVDSVVVRANRLFVEHNAKMDTIVMECCGDGNPCDGAQGMCKHFYDSAPAGEFGTAHYMIRALMDIFGPRDGCK